MPMATNDGFLTDDAVDTSILIDGSGGDGDSGRWSLYLSWFTNSSERFDWIGLY